MTEAGTKLKVRIITLSLHKKLGDTWSGRVILTNITSTKENGGKFVKPHFPGSDSCMQGTREKGLFHIS